MLDLIVGLIDILNNCNWLKFYSVIRYFKYKIFIIHVHVFLKVNCFRPEGYIIIIKNNGLIFILFYVLCIFKTCFFFFWSPPFSIDKLIESAEIISGVNNIYNCTTSSGHREMNRKVAGNKSYIRNIQIDIKRGHPMMLNLQPRMADKVEFWEIHFKSHSYIYKQVHVIESGFFVQCNKGFFSLYHYCLLFWIGFGR